jgi:hypothetical protein
MSIEPTSLGGRVDSTMFAALHGELAFHPWWDPVNSQEDAYSLFYARSSAMGWLDEATENTPGGVWGMNDAGQEPEERSRPSRILWSQVSVSEPIPAGRPWERSSRAPTGSPTATRAGGRRCR